MSIRKDSKVIAPMFIQKQRQSSLRNLQGFVMDIFIWSNIETLNFENNKELSYTIILVRNHSECGGKVERDSNEVAVRSRREAAEVQGAVAEEVRRGDAAAVKQLSSAHQANIVQRCLHTA